jgi:hypothetical protein
MLSYAKKILSIWKKVNNGTKNLVGSDYMTVGDLIKRLEKIDKDKMCIWKESVEDEGWANLDIQEEYYYLYFTADTKPLFDD